MMKKVGSFLILIFCSLMVFACSCGKEPSISYKYNQLTINMDEVFTINENDIKVKNSKSNFEIIILNEEIATIDEYTIKPLQKGATKVRIQLVDDADYYFDITLIVTHIIYTNSAYIDKENIQINLCTSATQRNNLTIDNNSNEIPYVSFNKEIIDYDYKTGLITAKKVGETVVVVKFKNCNCSFRVTIVDVVYTTQIEVFDATVFVGASGKLDFLIFPDIANTYEFYSDSELVEITKEGMFEAKAEGEAIIKVSYLTAPNSAPIQKYFTLKILPINNVFNIDIKNDKGQLCNTYFKDYKYRLILTDIIYMNYEDIVYSSNISISNITVENNNIYVDFAFIESGKQEINVVIKYNDDFIFKQSKIVDVNELEDISAKLIWKSYTLYPNNDGKYLINIESNNSSMIRFSLVLGAISISEDFTIFIVNQNVEERLESKTFTPTENGEYKLRFKIMETIVDEIDIIVNVS